MRDVTRWRYGQGEYLLDLMDEEAAARYMRCVEVLRAETSDGQAIGGVCGCLRRFFDALFGEGSAQRLMGTENNLAEALVCYADFLAFGQRQAERVERLLREMLTAYDPERVAR